MRKGIILFSLFASLSILFSCERKPIEAGFEDMINLTIYDYIVQNKEQYSSFLSILEKGGLDKTLSAYNPNGIDYTLFLPDNAAIDRFISQNNAFNSLNDLLNNTEYVQAFSRYHVVNMGIMTNDFPFGALPEYTLSGDLLTVGFIIEPDTSYYMINNQAAVIKPNIEVSNGYVHVVQSALTPLTFTTYDWLTQNPGYTIFREALEATGLKDTLDLNLKTDTRRIRPSTLLVEHDSIFAKKNIRSFQDLAGFISPNSSNYKSRANPLYNFMAYHILEGSLFLDDFEGVATNFNTYSDIPLNVNGLGIDIAINKGREVFKINVNAKGDTTLIDYVGILYDASNLITQTGSIHFINQVMRQFPPVRAIRNYEFWEETLFSQLRRESGSYQIKDPTQLSRITWTGADLFFIKTDDPDEMAWNKDYIFINGDFRITYVIPKIVQGKYRVFLGAHSNSQSNALVEVFIDGRKVGGLIDLTTGGSASNPYARKNVGAVEFLQFQDHSVEIVSLIPGAFRWDYLRFEPI
jgi:uncharacterized surface protein with fasciclin (FAS1) repeats